LNLTTFSPVGDPLMMSWADGDAHERLMYADNLAIDEKDGILLVTDLGNARFDMFDLDKLANVGVYGVPNGFYDYGLRNVHPNNPGGITFDATTGYIFVVDDKKMRRIQIFNEKSGFLGSVTNEHLVTPEKLISNKGRLFVVDIDSDTNEWCVNLFESSANRTYRQDLTDP